MRAAIHFSTWSLAFALACSAAAEVRFNRDIRPIVSETCFRCHGPDKGSRMAGMRLDIRDEALKALPDGTIPIVPGSPEKSGIIQRIFAANGRQMPPPYIHKELTQAQKETMRQWVAEGAKYEGHWAYQPVERPAAAGPGNPIDAFIVARLARENLSPSPEADRRTLLRRVTLDLTGLPPTPEEIAAFLKDNSADAYEKVVDRLLASPRYAEQQAIHWLDAVRYADTCGFHGDNAFPAWPYRDYVLHAFRDDKPFDQFTREQLAGDLLPHATIEQRVASAYNRLNRTSAEGGIQAKEYLAKYGADRVRTTSTVWMGSTLGCAECHDHKFDPFLSRDFYAMKAFFADIKETGLVPDRGAKAWGSVLAMPTPEQARRQAELKTQLADAEAHLAARMKGLAAERAAWEKQMLARLKAGELAWKVQRPIAAQSAHGAVLKIYNDEPVDFTNYDGSNLTSSRGPGNGLVIVSGPNPDTEIYTVSFKPGAGMWKALEIQVVQDESLPGIRVARGADRLVISEVEGEASGHKLHFSFAGANLNNPAAEYPPMAAIDGDLKTGWAMAAYNDVAKAALALRLAEPLHTEADTVVTLRLHQESEFRRATMGRFRIALSQAADAAPSAEAGKEIPERVQKAMAKAESERKDDDRKAIDEYYEWASAELLPDLMAVARLRFESARLDTSIDRTVVSEATDPTETRILPRGNWMDDTGAVVLPAIPVFLGKLSPAGPRATRLDLANWLVSPTNPLTARVFVNRMWRQFFGTGITKSLDDLGSQGEWPTHPELLDWLAAEFMNPEWKAGASEPETHTWDIRHIIRTIVLSKTYRQSSAPRADLAEKDPYDRLLGRQTRFRVDAENVHDIALFAAGLLVEKLGGPSVKPYQPDGYLAPLNFPKREYSASHGADLYRRGIYTFWQRTFLHPSLAAFDAPTREECTINRINSNTPLQALVLLNDPIYVEAARVFAQNLLQQERSLDGRIDRAFERAVSRPATAAEHRTLGDLYRTSLAEYRQKPEEAEALIHSGEAALPATLKASPAEFAALTVVTRAVLNMHETITRN
ncbi:MAG TPA: PSD1 and planctomycete cytochrome C domain-containing protein [Verrucomicrobiae bacterium]|nr:PSD1 and planctomycete cytochrome C domain-containing protein [Verrucomicrobiae bacterium]